MTDRGIRVVATDLATGETSEKTLTPGSYALVVAAPCYLAAEQLHSNGTNVLTLKGCAAPMGGTAVVPKTPGGAS